MINRRSLLKAAPAAAVAPWSLAHATELHTTPIRREGLPDNDLTEYAVLLLRRVGNPVWGPKPFMIVRQSAYGESGIQISFLPYDVKQNDEFTGVHLIHQPTRTKYEAMPFSAHACVCAGDQIKLVVTKVF